MHTSRSLIGTCHVVKHGPELGCGPLSGLLEGFERGSPVFGIDSFGLQAHSDSWQICDTGALHGEGWLSRLDWPFVADETVRAFPQRFVGEITLPLDNGGARLHLPRSGEQGLLNGRVRCLRERAEGKRR